MAIDYRQAHFWQSAPARGDIPGDYGAEVAFAGRSNAGKSSALNALTEQHQLARVSKTPGRTPMINLFSLDPHRRLVDLPGYGYAEVSQSLRAQWHQSLADYLSNREALQGIILLMDIRHPFTDPDVMLMDLADRCGKPVHVLLTKCDKLGYGAAKAALMAAQRELGARPDRTVQLFSSVERKGLDELRHKLDGWLAKVNLS